VTASARQPSWGEVLDAVQGSRLKGVHTAMVGQIRSYSEAEQTAEVTLAVQLETTEGEFEEVAPLGDVPVAWPGAWAAGDSCLLVFCEESFAKWWDTGSVEQPEVLRRHGLHAVCIPIVARAGQAVDFVALAALVKARLDAIQQAFDSHTHTVSGTCPPGTSGGPLTLGTAAAPASPIGALDSVAAIKVKAR
jgi:hypothetical protein